MKNELGKVIMACRKTQSLTQEYIAYRIGLTVTSYANIEHGRVELNVSKLCLIAEIFNIHAHQLLALAEEAHIYKEFNHLPIVIKKMIKRPPP